MDVIFMIVVVFAALLTPAASNLLSEEFVAWQPWIVRKLIALAASWMPAEDRARWTEEWSGFCAEVPGNIGKVIAALGFVNTAARVNQRDLSYWFTKRLWDMAVAFVAVLILAPLFTIIATLIRLSGPGPIFIRRPRIGKDGRPFNLLTFRTMNIHGKATLIGRILSRTAIDATPMIFNILKGDMSVVGPRPRSKDWHEKIGLVDADLTRTLVRVRPGVAPVISSIRSIYAPVKNPLEELIDDVAYVNNASWKGDLRAIYMAYYSEWLDFLHRWRK